MRDDEIVAAIVAGDPAGLAEAYDTHADALYAYCRFMLADPAGAADAVRDAFILATWRLARLREPQFLRAWLYAVSRNQCLRQLRARRGAPGSDEADVEAPGTDTAVDIPAYTERAALAALVRSAAPALAPGEREVIQLAYGHGLNADEIALVLEVSLAVGDSLLARSCEELLACLGDLLVAREGRADCPELDAALGEWDGRFTPLVGRRVHRHVQQCVLCADRYSTGLREAATALGRPPAGWSFAEALADLLAQDTRLPGSAPDPLREHVLWLSQAQGEDLLMRGLLDRDPVVQDLLERQADVRSRAGAFGRHGFPKPVQVPSAGYHQPRRSPRRAAVSAAVAVAAAAVVATALLVNGEPTAGPVDNIADQPSLAITSQSPLPSFATVPPMTGAPLIGTPTATATPSATPTPSATATPSVTASPSATASATASGRPGPSSSASPTGTPATGGTSAPPAPKPSVTTTRPAQGTLAVSPSTVMVSPFQSGSVTLTAEDGPVSWSIASSSAALTLSATSGTLAAGQSVTVSVTAQDTGQRRFSAELTVSPGDEVITVEFFGPGR